ncbi:hypothetical protein QQG55_49025 [Brugia pahangi]
MLRMQISLMSTLLSSKRISILLHNTEQLQTTTEKDFLTRTYNFSAHRYNYTKYGSAFLLYRITEQCNS